MVMPVIKYPSYPKLTCNRRRMWKRKQMVTICSSTRMIVINVVEENCYSKVSNEQQDWHFSSVLPLSPLSVGTVDECEEYCQGDGTLLIDDATWLNNAPQVGEQSTGKSNNASQTQEKNNKRQVHRRPSQKRLKISDDGHVSVDHQVEDDPTHSSNRCINGTPTATTATNNAGSRKHRNNNTPVLGGPATMLDLTNISGSPRNASASSTREANRITTAGAVVQESSTKESEVNNGGPWTLHHLSLC